MKRIPAIVGTVLAATAIASTTAGCGSDHTTPAAATTTATTTAPAEYTWNTFRTAYDHFLTADCKAKQGDEFASCANWQAQQVNTMLADVKQLPANKTRTDAEQAMTNFLGIHTSMTNTGCLVIGGMDSIGACSISRLGSDAAANGLQTFIRMGAA
ncbi:hypothetical protein [Nocardia terpenica]|uniref:Secreted protein n=1 Tax=Nocardia terpenica TaxID=455432 RepID=A0A164LBD3_9NOCA|nr:hypothetical protein [Nocardia terpenica]KZM72219.1 hypothetical protein AWN90_36700 [Nocardia terpenica]NQE86637.1 hypothetical protein [Nocardia terpenica]